MSVEFLRLYQAIVSVNQMVYSELRNSNTNVETLLKETVKHSEDTLLHAAANWKRDKIAETIINLQPSLLSATNAKGETPLHVAASVGRQEVTRVIIDGYGQIEAVETGEIILRKKTEKNEETALHKAVKNGNLHVVKLLIVKDHELTKLVNKDGESPLFMAVDTQQYEIASSILTVSGCSFKGRKNMNALHAAIAHDTMHRGTGLTNDLIEKREARLLQQQDDDFGWTPLHYAAHINATQAIRLLLLADHSTAYIKDSDGMTALHIAAKQGYVPAVEKLVRMCPEICGIIDNNGQSFFHVAVKSRKIRVVRFILGKRYHFFFDVLLYLFFPNMLQFVHSYYGSFDLQLFPGDLLNMQDYQENTALHLAALQEHHFVLFLLTMDHRLSKVSTNSDGLTVLDIMAEWKYTPSLLMAIAFALLENGGTKASEQLLNRKKIKKTPKTSGAEVDEVGGMRQINFLVATIIATVSFTAALSVPGGFKNEGLDEGTAALAQRSDFHKFVIFNAIAFGLSVTAIFISRYIRSVKILFENLTLLLTQAATLAMVVAFIYGSSAVLGHSEAELATSVKHVIWVCLSIIYFVIRLA